MKLNVNKESCIGCGACTGICPDVFEIGEDGLAEVIVDKISEELKEEAIDAMEGCPTLAIYEEKEESNENE